MLKTKTSCCAYELGKETAGINIAFGHMAEDVFCVRNTPLGEKSLCLFVQLKWKIEENLESQGLSLVT